MAVQIGAVRLHVSDLEGMRDYYERALGLRTVDHGDGLARLGAGDATLVELHARSDAPRRPPGTTGLFHFAILVPSRAELARALRRAVDGRLALSGASDHLVSEAIYLRDPEGNGIEVYRDRPREEWPQENGGLRMDTLPLDVDGVLGELEAVEPFRTEVPPATRVGHVHLQVADLGAAEEFYAGVLGFDVTVRSYPGALFVSSGGYHHHVGLNTWAGEGAPPPPAGSLGLSEFEIAGVDLGSAERRLADAGAPVERRADGLRTADPSQNGVLLRS